MRRLHNFLSSSYILLIRSFYDGLRINIHIQTRNKTMTMRKFLLLMLSFLLLTAELIAQNRTITGKITDEKGNGVPNASVVVKGTNIGTTTSIDGTFSLAIPSNARTIVVSYVGMGDREVGLSSNSAYNVRLTASSGNMEEIVVTGYGTAQKRKNSTASSTTLRGKEFENKPQTSVDQMLGGKVPGLFAPSFSGQPGANQQIRIRGIGSISAGANPLFVVDGVILNTGDLSRLTTTSN